MAIKSDTLKEAKSALKTMSKGDKKRLTKAEFVASLIKEIHEKMKLGFSIEEICIELNKTLEPCDQIKLNTFRSYVRKAREEAGIKPTRTWTKRADGDSEKDHKGDISSHRKEYKKEDTASDFRNQMGEL